MVKTKFGKLSKSLKKLCQRFSTFFFFLMFLKTTLIAKNNLILAEIDLICLKMFLKRT